VTRIKTVRLRGLVLKRVQSGEADKLITVFSKSLGKVTCKAKGVRRLISRRAPHLELFNEVEMLVYLGPGLPLIFEAQTISNFLSFRTNAHLLGLAFYICEVVDKLLPEKEPHELVYNLVTQGLSKLNEMGGGEITNMRAFGVRVIKEHVTSALWELGYLPRGNYPTLGLTAFVEEVAERKIQSRKFLEETV
jgi:DNA repair protein RecO